LPYVNDICNDVERIGQYDVDEICRKILTKKPDAVIFGSDRRSKELSARIAARLSLGLCADCTRLEAVDGHLVMYRPALSGSVIAMIKSTTRPAMATVRTQSADVDSIVVCAGYGVKDSLDSVKALCRELGAGFAASRRLVDNGYAAYSDQVGLTGKTVSPRVYIAIGVSGAVHHTVGMQRSATVIAINPDKNAPIFEYADYGIIDEFE
jgi:electron transfer flavoprotein alpha subunit